MSNISTNFRLSPSEWKALVRAKGWTYKELAERWDGKTPEYISMIGRDPNRPKHYDDAVIGLPTRGKGKRATVAQIMRRAAKGADVLALTTSSTGAVPAARRRPAGPGYRYHGFLQIGDVVTVSTDLGQMASEGDRGVVVELMDTGKGERYRIVFESGQADVFEPDHVDRYLVAAGLTDEGAAGYVYENEEQLRQDFASGQFDFRRGNS